MRLLLEGPDNAGKTTLAKFIHEAVPNSFYYHPGARPDDMYQEMKCLEDQKHLFMHHNFIIQDRCTAISQRVYNPHVNLDIVRKSFMDEMLALGIVVIYARPNFDRLMRIEDFTWREGEDEEHKQKIIKNQATFIERYDKIMAAIPCVTYDYEDETVSKIVRSKCVGAMSGNSDDFKWLKHIMHYRKV